MSKQIPSLKSTKLSEESPVPFERASKLAPLLASTKVSAKISLQELQHKLDIELKNELLRECYQSSSENVLKLYKDSHIPSELKLQGSAADGFLIHGWFKSDIDFLYSMNIFNASLKLKELISDPSSPAYVKIEVIPNYSECKTDIEKEKLMANIEHKDCQYFLNMEHMKQEIYQQISKRLENSSEYASKVRSENYACFRTQFDYDIFKVISNYVTHQIDHLKEFSENMLKTTEFKENIKQLFNNLSGNYIVSQYKWLEFQERLQLTFFTEKSPSTLKTNFSKNIILQQKSLEVFNIYFREINEIIDGIINDKFWFWSCLKIFEDCFYLLLSLLLHCDVDTIVEVIKDKIISVEHQNNKLEENNNSYEKLNFTEEEIKKIINFDLFSILNEPITQQEKEIENIFRKLIKTNSIEIRKKVMSEEGPKLIFLQEFLKMRKGDINDRISRNKLEWLSSMIKLLSQFLENVRCLWNCYLYPDDLSSEILMVEIIPGIKFEGWPVMASEWPIRERYWPEPEIIQRIIKKDFHVVFKYLDLNTGFDGRLSFSEAENIMCHAMTRDQTIVYNFIKFQLKAIDSKNLKSYYLKTICLWVFEVTPLDNNSKNIQEVYLKDIIKRLCKALKDRKLRHYFLPDYNLFKELKDVDFDEIINSLWNIDSDISKFHLELMEKKTRNPETKVRTFFKLVENVLCEAIDGAFKNIIPEIK